MVCTDIRTTAIVPAKVFLDFLDKYTKSCQSARSLGWKALCFAFLCSGLRGRCLVFASLELHALHRFEHLHGGAAWGAHSIANKNSTWQPEREGKSSDDTRTACHAKRLPPRVSCVRESAVPRGGGSVVYGATWRPQGTRSSSQQSWPRVVPGYSSTRVLEPRVVPGYSYTRAGSTAAA